MDDLIQQGVDAYKSGDHETARKLLTEAVSLFPDSQRAWGWMCNVSTTDQERIHCLKQIIRINPYNKNAKDDLLKLENILSKVKPDIVSQDDLIKKIKNRSIAAIVLVMLVAIGAITLAVFAQISVSKKTEALAIEKVLVSKTVSALREAQLTTEAQLAKEKKGNVIASTAQAELSKRLTKANMDKIMASTTQEALSRRVTDLSSQLRDQINLVSTLEAKNMCDNNAPSFINYYDNSTVSKSLKDWLNKTEENIYSATWDTTWSNSKTAIHKLTGEYLYVFIVYFDEPKLDHEHSTFDFQSRCWLDR